MSKVCIGMYLCAYTYICNNINERKDVIDFRMKVWEGFEGERKGGSNVILF